MNGTSKKCPEIEAMCKGCRLAGQCDEMIVYTALLEWNGDCCFYRKKEVSE